MVSTMGCCNSDVTPPDWVNQALRRYPLTTYMNPSGEYLQIVLIDSGFDSRASSDDVNPNYDCIAYDPRTRGMFFPSVGQKMMSYTQVFNYNQFSIMGINFSTSGSFQQLRKDSTLMLQSTVFEHCSYFYRTDSIGTTEELVLSPLYGLVLFSKRDDFRWERVLEP